MNYIELLGLPTYLIVTLKSLNHARKLRHVFTVPLSEDSRSTQCLNCNQGTRLGRSDLPVSLGQ